LMHCHRNCMVEAWAAPDSQAKLLEGKAYDATLSPYFF
jgi:hypothetical protein